MARYQIAELNSGSFQSSSFKVYPNPFLQSITIENKNINLANATFESYDISGRKLSEYKSECTTDFKIPMDKNLVKGNYFLKINSEQKSETVKISKR